MPEARPGFTHVLDTSALLCYLADEPAAGKVAGLQSRSAVPFIVYSELYYLIWKRKGRAEADSLYALVKSWGLETLLPDERVILAAGRLKAVYRLGLADSYVAAFALIQDATLATLDSDFLALRQEIDVLKL